MKEHNVILEKTFDLGLRIIKLFKHLRQKKKLSVIYVYNC